MPSAATVRLVAVLGLALYVIVRLALVRLQGYPYPLDLGAAWTGAMTTAPATVPALLAVWTVLGLSIVGLAGWLRRRAPDLLTSEAALGAAIVLWAMTYLALLVLGPMGLYRPNVLRVLLVLIVAATFRWRPGPRRGPWPPGAWVAVLAAVLVLPPLLLMQIGSPVSPFMDILALIAAVQKVVTFQLYDPFANDASGIIALGRGSVGYDAPFSF